MSIIRVAVLTDIHYGFDFRDKLGSRAPALMERFIKWTDRLKDKPAFVVEMGDRANSRNADDARSNMRKLKDYFNRLAMPVCHLLGNNDLKNLDRAENEEITGSPSESYSMDEGGWHFVFWNPHATLSTDGIVVSKADIDWLKNDIDAATKATAVFCHVPFYDRNEKTEIENDRASGIISRFSFKDAPDLRKIFEESGKVRLAMGGHRHRNSYAAINGVHYVTLQSLTGQHREKYKVPAGTWSMLEFGPDDIEITIYGKARMRFDGELKKSHTMQFSTKESAPLQPAAPRP